ncbi:AAA family ATPase [Microbacterium sp. NPDC077057]|uniref:AAA family ATPase n=1 Tax=Microbacterium sp. NPDC077057 TaxID=3154763 RepID=UPI00344620DD
MNVAGRELIELSLDRARAHYDDLIELVDGAPSMIPSVAFRIGQLPPRALFGDDDIVAALLSVAEVTDAERKKWRKKARAALRKGHDALAYTVLNPDALGRQASVDAEAEKIRIREDARRLIAEEAMQGDEPADDYADVAALIEAGVQRRVPDAGALRNDGVRLAYSGAVNGLVGPPESGKTLVAIASACDTLKTGGNVLHIDSDHNGAEATISHYIAADGIGRDVLADRARFRYVDVRSADHLRRVVTEAVEWSPSLVVVDSVGEIVPLMGGESNSNDDYRRIHREILSPLADGGAAVLVHDHVTKEEGRGGYAIGAGAKKAAIDGSYLAVAPVEPFVPGIGGAASLSILKDRHGGLRAESPAGKSPTAAVFRLDSRDGTSSWEFWRGRAAEDREGEQAEADVAHVLTLDPFPTSRTKLQAALKASQGKAWSTDRAQAAYTEARRRRESAPTTFPIESKE